MKTVRRLYFYLVALISLEVVLWGLINLLRTMFSSGIIFPGADTLAQALALVFVGVPIFAVHWVWIQKNAHSGSDESSNMVRALFFYAALLLTLVPVVQNVLALLNRSLINLAGIAVSRALLGGSQSLTDNLIAIFLNLVAGMYFFNVLRGDWPRLTDQENFRSARRLYRYLWMLYGLGMTVFGAQQILSFIFSTPGTLLGEPGRELFINGLCLLIIGSPLWYYRWDMLQKSLAEESEHGSILRLVTLYLLSLISINTVLVTAGMILSVILEFLLGKVISWSEFLSQVGSPFSVGLPLGMVWWYYSTQLTKEINSVESKNRRAALRRFYLYILSLIGLVATFLGLSMLMSFFIRVLVQGTLWGDDLRTQLSYTIATLVTAMPLWFLSWMPLQDEATAEGEDGSHARQSVIRRSYLYIVIFATVLGGMASAIYLVYTVLVGFLDHFNDTFQTDVLNGLQLLSLFAAFLIYHFSCMRQDNKRAAVDVATRQSNFPVLIFEKESSGFAQPIYNAIKEISTSFPVAIQSTGQSIPENAGASLAVILPSDLALEQPEALRLWLNEYSGQRLLVPVKNENWYLPVDQSRITPAAIARAIRDLSEGQKLRDASAVSSSTVQTLAYVFAALFLAQMLLGLLVLGISLITGG